ncbi:MAG: flagellar brake protein [Gammaproteobacteria bacterium]|nr:flagellar brake protein [Gammaproteobacteria bacterium]
MEELELTIGMSLNLQLMVGERKRRHDVQVIGFHPKGSLIVSMPKEKGSFAKVFPHDEYVVRYFRGTNIVAFKTKVLHIATIPYHHLHLECPQNFEKLAVRQAERIHIMVNAQTLVNSEKHWSVIRDLSTSGACVVVHNDIAKPDEHIELYFDLSIGDIEREIHLVAVVRNVHKEHNKDSLKDEYCYGVEFIDPSEEDAVFVQGYVYEQLLNHRHD